MRVVRIVAILVPLALSAQRTVHAVDAFEVQVYDGSADTPGTAGLEAHVNGVVAGVRTAPPPEIAPHHLVHLTLEPSYGVVAFWEVGAYLQTALRPDGSYDFAGVKLRSKLVTPRDWHPSWRIGANVEVSYLPARYEAERWGAELRPIVAWSDTRWLLAVNPILDFSLTHASAPALEPAAMVVVKIHGILSAGVEYYAGLGPLDALSAARDQLHVVYEVINVHATRDLEINFGVGEGLTSASNPLTVKAIIGYGFDWTPRAPESAVRQEVLR